MRNRSVFTASEGSCECCGHLIAGEEAPGARSSCVASSPNSHEFDEAFDVLLLWLELFEECLVNDFVQAWRPLALLLLFVLDSLPLRGMVELLNLKRREYGVNIVKGMSFGGELTVLVRILGRTAPWFYFSQGDRPDSDLFLRFVFRPNFRCYLHFLDNLDNVWYRQVPVWPSAILQLTSFYIDHLIIHLKLNCLYKKIYLYDL